MNEKTTFVSTKDACKFYQVSVSTLRRWDQDGQIDTYRTPGNQRRYSKLLHTKNNNGIVTDVQKEEICYCRVSSSIQITELFRILVQVSIGNEMDLKPFWNLRCKENSKHLWLPTEIDYADSLSNSFNGSLKQITSNSWFSMNQFVPLNKNCQKTYCQSYTCSLADKWTNGGIKKNKSIGTYKIKINPTIDQQVILNK